MRSLAFLINPVSGGGAGAAIHARLEEVLGSFGMDRSAWTSEITDPARLEEQADTLLRSSRKLVAVGGDGTIGNVLDRARRLRSDAVIGLIPLGTGNDLGRVLGVYRVYDSKGLVACLKRLLMAPSVPFDLWDAGDGAATAASYLSVGLDAAVLRDFDHARRSGQLRGGTLGYKLYYLRALAARSEYRLPQGSRALLRTEAGEVEIDLAGKPALLAANIGSYAAGARPVPGARADDGLLDVAVFDKLWRYVAVNTGSRVLPAVARWSHLPRHRARSIELRLPPGTPVQIDGEDFTDRLPLAPLRLSFAARVRLLDLRRSFYALF